jgi:hypothetical protein
LSDYKRARAGLDLNAILLPARETRRLLSFSSILSAADTEANIMFLTIGVILILLWALGAFIVPVGGGLIHILLVIAVISVVWHLMSGRRARI